MTAEPTRVYLTFDVEGAEARTIRGEKWPPQGYDARVWGRFSNQPSELGLRFVLDELEAAGLPGTFFVEAFGAELFGEDGLAAICGELRGRGHDVQLHAHPIQRRGHGDGTDQMADFDEAQQAELLEQGLTVLGRCGVPREELVGFRAGNFGADNRTWRAMGRVGLRVSSNFNPCYFHRCKMRRADARPALFAAEGVWELPVTNFRESGGGNRHLQITAISLLEMRHVLERARRLGLAEVTVVAHPFEFFYIDSIPDRRGRPNNINRWRLRALCQFLAAHRDDFVVDTVGALGRRLGPAPAATSESSAAADAPPHVPILGHPALKLGRLAEQMLKRVESRLPIGLPLVRDRIRDRRKVPSA